MSKKLKNNKKTKEIYKNVFKKKKKTCSVKLIEMKSTRQRYLSSSLVLNRKGTRTPSGHHLPQHAYVYLVMWTPPIDQSPLSMYWILLYANRA